MKPVVVGLGVLAVVLLGCGGATAAEPPPGYNPPSEQLPEPERAGASTGVAARTSDEDARTPARDRGPSPDGRPRSSQAGVARATAAGDAGNAPQGGTPTATVVLVPDGRAPSRVRVEIAVTDAQQERGLMFRRHLDPDAGMLFVYGAPEQQTFWMKNTYIPLDMIFIGADRHVVGVVANAAPLTTVSREVDAPSQYVLEVNGGFAAHHGIGVGTPVQMHNVPRIIEPEQGSAGAPTEEDR